MWPHAVWVTGGGRPTVVVVVVAPQTAWPSMESHVYSYLIQ